MRAGRGRGQSGPIQVRQRGAPGSFCPVQGIDSGSPEEYLAGTTLERLIFVSG